MGLIDRRLLGRTSLFVRELDLLAVAAREGPHGSGTAPMTYQPTR